MKIIARCGVGVDNIDVDYAKSKNINVKNLFDITDRSYVLGEQTVIAEGTSRELLKSSKAIEHYFGSQFS